MLIALAFAVWLVALFGVWRVMRAWLTILKLAPETQKLETMWGLGFWQFEKVAAATGPDSKGPIKDYLTGFAIFAGAIIAFAAITIAGIVTGQAA